VSHLNLIFWASHSAEIRLVYREGYSTVQFADDGMRDQFILYWELQPENRAVSYLHTEPYEEDLAGGATLRELKSSKGGDRRDALEESAVTRVLRVLVCQDVGRGVRMFNHANLGAHRVSPHKAGTPFRHGQ